MVNRYPGRCVVCGGRVPALGGVGRREGRRFVLRHLACAKSGRPEVVTFRFSSGATATQNARGRCEDAPCCGCCTV